MAAARESLNVLEEQVAVWNDALDDARIRALVSETPLQAHEYDDISRHVAAANAEMQRRAREVRELTDARDRHPRAYLRERAAALLKVADGIHVPAVAAAGLLKPRKEDTVRDWVHRYQAGGLAALLVRPGRGRRPAFSPSEPPGRG